MVWEPTSQYPYTEMFSELHVWLIIIKILVKRDISEIELEEYNLIYIEPGTIIKNRLRDGQIPKMGCCNIMLPRL